MAVRCALVAIVTVASSAKIGNVASVSHPEDSSVERTSTAEALRYQVSPPPFNDWHYPPEELEEQSFARELRLMSADEQEQVRRVPLIDTRMNCALGYASACCTTYAGMCLIWL